MTLDDDKEVPSRVYADIGIVRKKALLYLAYLMPGCAIYFIYLFIMIWVAVSMFEEQPTAFFTWVMLGLLMLSIAIASTLVNSCALVIFRVLRVEMYPSRYVVTFVLGPRVALVKPLSFVKESFLVDLSDVERWGSMAKVFRHRFIPIVIARSMQNFDEICDALTGQYKGAN